MYVCRTCTNHSIIQKDKSAHFNSLVNISNNAGYLLNRNLIRNALKHYITLIYSKICRNYHSRKLVELNEKLLKSFVKR